MAAQRPVFHVHDSDLFAASVEKDHYGSVLEHIGRRALQLLVRTDRPHK